LRKISTKSDGTAIANAFAGSMVNASADLNLDYEDDALYFGYTRKDNLAGTWTQGGVARLQTNDDTDPDRWTISTVIDGVGPVTASVARLQNNTFHSSWLYFGTGRYFYESLNASDDADSPRGLFGIKDPCMNTGNTLDARCTSSVSPSDLTLIGDNTVITDTVANGSGFAGWKIALDTVTPVSYDNGAAIAYRAERVITDPLATSSGSVFFTTYRPYGEDCSLGGKSFIWAARYNTGGFVGTTNLKGKALVQVSTASVEQLDLSTVFGNTPTARATLLHRGGRRSGAMEGVPPTAQGLSLISPPPPVNRVLHMKEH
ncbi:MAG TPA: hypothetical protein VIU29_06415, partial [Candidatus Deferrimicrobiaceae bacterium]